METDNGLNPCPLRPEKTIQIPRTAEETLADEISENLDVERRTKAPEALNR
jgi:hypothetical protein